MARAEPGRATALRRAEPVQAAPVQAAPVQAAPVQAEPVQAAPVQAAPVQAAPVQAAPVQAAPVQAEPVQAAPVQAAPVQAEPVQAEPGQAGSPASGSPPRRSRRRWRRRALAALLLTPALGALLLLALAWPRSVLEAPEPTQLLRDRHGAFLAELPMVAGRAPETARNDAIPAWDDLGFWPVDAAAAPRVAAALIAIEDQRFWQHPGVDPQAVARALRQNLASGRRISGASTLAMQVARMQRPGPRTYPRKALEATTALLLVARHGRRAVLHHYLRIVPFGNRVRGVGYAARRYFDKPAADLSWAEIAFLASIPQAPARMNPFEPIGRARAVRRGARILDALRASDVISADEHALARAQLRVLRVPMRATRPAEMMHAILRLGASAAMGSARIDRSMPIVDTTLDLALQREIAAAARDHLDALRARGAENLAVLVVDLDPQRGPTVRAALGSADYFDDDASGAIDYLRVPRSAGSTLKPLLYALAHARGVLAPNQILDDLGRGAGGIVNSDGRYLGPLLPAVALANSRNVPAVDLLARLGLGAGYGFLADLDLHDGREPASTYGLGLAVGNLPVTLEGLTAAYAMLARDGRLAPLRWRQDDPIVRGRRVLPPSAARQVVGYLADPQARLPSFPRMGWGDLPFPVALKTGTSSRFRDAWTVAFTSRWLVAAWVGRPDARPMAGVTGYQGAAKLVHALLAQLHGDDADGLADGSFPSPPGHARTRVCALTGGAPGPACPRRTGVWRSENASPPAPCRAHHHVAVDRATGLLATASTPRAQIETRIAIDLPPRYADWLRQRGAPAARHAATSAPATRVRIIAPEANARYFFDPETPASMATLALRASVEGASPSAVIWTVDGVPIATAPPPYAARWRLRRGVHRIEARLPGGGASGAVTIRVD
ncbi:MAG: transglycosylase domain-containing protein [Acidobacteriota bacterium]